ncbi:unnamed protein product, partial [Choristocarpus tenellus]
MSRSRRTVARFDPSPAIVAPWNDTSAAARKKVELQARLRHGLVGEGIPIPSTAGKKRPRGHVYSTSPNSSPAVREAQRELNSSEEDEEALCGPPPAVVSLQTLGPPTLLSSGSGSGSGSGSSITSVSDTDGLSWACDGSAQSAQAWRDGQGGGGVCGSVTDTDSEASSDVSGGSGSLSSNAQSGNNTEIVERPEDKEGKNKGRNVVRVRVARSQMPYQWAESPPEFRTCLTDFSTEEDVAPGAAAAISLMGLCAGDRVDAKTWLTSGFIDVVMAKFARTYLNVHFMPIEFAALSLRGMGLDSSGGGAGGRSGPPPDPKTLELRDILGRKIIYRERRPIIFLANIQNLHWNLLRVEHVPVPELQLFEPMGKPARRQSSKASSAGGGGSGASGGGWSSSGGAVFRYIPREVFWWLDAAWPLEGGPSGTTVGVGNGVREYGGGKRHPVSWASRAYSAITRQQQKTGFDCGVASLLYAEKCGQGQMREDVDEWTTQEDMTVYRQALQKYIEFLLQDSDP